ncbi:MAG: hypothetical protein SGARI_001941, partial [Bacillariaceae sp.]
MSSDDIPPVPDGDDDMPPPVITFEDHSSGDEEVHKEDFHDEGSPKKEGNDKEAAPFAVAEVVAIEKGTDKFEDDHSGDSKSEENELYEELQQGRLHVISNVVFVVASAIYVALEVTMLPYYRFYKDVPYHVRETEDDDVWWNYYNETGAFPEWLLNATDDYTWMEWYNNSFLDEEENLGEFLFQVPNAAEKYEFPNEDYAAWVSQYMVLYFVAALGFLVTGILEVYAAKGHFWSIVLYSVMILAALFGIASAMMVNKDEYVSIVLNAVSVHLFAVEAIAIIIQRCKSLQTVGLEEESLDDKGHYVRDSCVGLSILSWLLVGDFCFFLGTSGDVVLSYFYIFEQDYIEHAGAAIATAVFWLLASLIYLAATNHELHQTKNYFKESGLREKERDNAIIRWIIVALVVLAIVIMALGLAFGLPEEGGDAAAATFAPTDFSTSWTYSPSLNGTDILGTLTPSGDGTMDIGTDEPSDSMGTPDPSIPAGTLDPTECVMEMSEFSQSTIKLTMTTTASVSAVEIRYAANVLAKAFGGVSMDG